MQTWPVSREWDGVPFHFRVYDLKGMVAEGKNPSEPNHSSSQQRLPPDAHRKNLAALAIQIKATHIAEVILSAITTSDPASF